MADATDRQGTSPPALQAGRRADKPKPPDASSHEGNWYVLFFGLDSSSDHLALGGGMTLRRLPAPISIFDLAALGAAGFREWAVLEPMIRGCRVEIESPADSTGNSGYDTLHRIWLVSALLVLRGFGAHLPIAANTYSWQEVIGAHRKSPPTFRGHLLDYHLRMIRLANTRTDPVNEDDAAWVRDVFPEFDRFAAEDTRFRFALESAVAWRYQQDVRSSVAQLWAGIESLFNVGAELTFRIAVSAASLLEPRGASRSARFKSIQDLYARRSRVVHGNRIGDEEILLTCAASFELLRDLLLMVVRHGRLPTAEDIQSAIFES